MGERDMPAAGPITGHPVGLDTRWHRPRHAKPHPAHLGHPHPTEAAIQPHDVRRFHRDLPKPFMHTGLAPRRATVRAGKEVSHGLREIPQRLLLHGLTAGTKPRVLGAGLGQLRGPLDVAGSLTARLPMLLLLHRQIPHIPRIPAVRQQMPPPAQRRAAAGTATYPHRNHHHRHPRTWQRQASHRGKSAFLAALKPAGFHASRRKSARNAACRGALATARGTRNTWRTLTSMGTALVLLFLLALGAIPGALLPQRSLNEAKVEQYIAEHPTIGPWLDRLQAFNVFSSFWFTSIYVLLFVSLVGCLTPRLVEHVRSLRATPVAAPRNLGRLPKHHTAEVAGDPDAVAAAVSGRLRGWRRVTRKEGAPSKSPPRRAICASSATSSSTSRCSACSSRWPPASCSATRATSSSSPTAARASARRRLPRSTRSGRATPSTARRCTRSACGSTTSTRTTCRPGRRRRSLPTSSTRQAPTSTPTPGGRTGWRSTSRCGSAATGCTCRATATPRRSPSRSPTGRPAPRRCSGGPTIRSPCCRRA